MPYTYTVSYVFIRCLASESSSGAEIVAFYFSIERLERTSKCYLVPSFRHPWSLELMTRQLRGPQRVITVEVQALSSDSCVDVWSQNNSLDCLSVPVGSWKTSLPSKPSRHPKCIPNPRFGWIRCSYLLWDEEGKGGGGSRRAVYPSSRELLERAFPWKSSQV